MVSQAVTPNAEQTIDYTLSMLGGLAEMSRAVGLDGLAGDLAALAKKHQEPVAAVERAN